MEEPKTYTADLQFEGKAFTCPRCHRKYPYPTEAHPSIRCECGWRYQLRSDGTIQDAFSTRLGSGMDFSRS